MGVEELWKVAAGVFGAVVAGIVSFQVWKRQQRATRREKFLQDRATAYRVVWEKLQQLEIEIRTCGRIDDDDADAFMLRMNETLMQVEIYLDPNDRTLVSDCLICCIRGARHVHAHGDAEDEKAMVTSCALPFGAIDVVRWQNSRMKIRDLVRQAQGGSPVPLQ